MLKPAFWLLFFLPTTATMVSAQDNEGLGDSLISIVEPAVEEEEENKPFDTIFYQLPVVTRTVPTRLVDSLKAAKEFWYANAAPAKKKKEPAATGQSLFQKRWFRNLLWVLILASFIGVLVWYLVSSNLFLFRKRAGTLNREEGEEERADDIFSIDYENQISAAAVGGNYRLAVRLWYLQTLKILAEKGLIDYRDGRTNQDYVSQLSRHAAYRDFFRLTRHFEYTWYGQFGLSEEAYDIAKGDFIHFQKGLS